MVGAEGRAVAEAEPFFEERRPSESFIRRSDGVKAVYIGSSVAVRDAIRPCVSVMLRCAHP